MAELILLDGNREVTRIRLSDAEISIGRLETADITIDSAKASRRHAKVVKSEKGYMLVDCESANGITINAVRITELALDDGTDVKIADHRLVFHETDGLPAAIVKEAAEEPEPWMQSETSNTTDEFSLLQSVLIDTTATDAGAKRLQALFEISKALEEAKDFKAVLVQIMDKAINIMGADRGFLMLIDDDGELRVEVARDRDGDITGVDQEKISRSLMRKVVEERKPRLVMEAPDELGTKSVIMHSIHAALCAPLMTQDVVSGVIYVDHRSMANAFRKQDLTFFTTFALQAKAAIDSSRAYWELVDSLFESSDDFIVVCGLDRKVKQANRAAPTFLGLTEEDLIGKALEELVIEEDREKAITLAGETLDKGVTSGNELNLMGTDGKVIPISISGFAMRDRVGHPIGTCLIGRDQSEIKELIGKLTSANEFIRSTFGRYLSDEVVESLLESPDHLELGGEKRRVSILMSDLRGFTGVAERLPPEDVVTIINNYLGVMTDVIIKWNGTIDEFIGDAILVIFGAPILREDDALRATACAMEMQLAMDEVNEKNRADGLPEVEMGIAITTGDVVVGNIGSAKRTKYAVVGTDVNLVGRVESTTVGGQVLITGSTVKDAGDSLLLGRKHEIQAKGVEGSLTVHELLGVGGNLDLTLPDTTIELTELGQALPIRCAELEGKQISVTFFKANLISLGMKGAILESKLELQPLTNLKLRFAVSGGDGDLHDTYGKIIERNEDGNYLLRFTSVPPDVRAFFDSVL